MSVLDQPSEIDVVVVPYETAQVEVPLSPEQEAYMTLDVVDNLGGPLPGAVVVLKPSSGTPVAKRTDSEGRVSFMAVPENTYAMEINPPGALLIERIHSDGTGFDLVGGARIQPGWTSMTPFELDSHLYLLLYNNDSGDVAIVRFTDNLHGIQQVWSDHWMPGWSSIRSFKHGNDVYLIESRPHDGAVVIDRLKPEGLGVDEIWRATWTTGWEVIRPFMLDDQWYLFEYKPEVGTVVIDRLKSGFQGVEEVWRSAWTKGWAIEVFCLDGRPHLIEHKITSGRIVIDRIANHGKGVQPVFDDVRNRRSYIGPFTVANVSQLISYLPDEQVWMVERLEGNGATMIEIGRWETMLDLFEIVEWYGAVYAFTLMN